MLSLSFKSIGNANSFFMETLEKKFKQYHVIYIFFIINSYNKHFINNLLVFNFYNTNIFKT